VVVFLEYDTNANPAVLNWANNVLQTNSNRRAIIVSHYLIGNGDQSNFRDQGQATLHGAQDQQQHLPDALRACW